MDIPGTNWYLGKVLGCFKERTSNSTPTVQGTEGLPCSEDQDRVFKTKRLLPGGRYMLTKLCTMEQWKECLLNLLNK